MKYAVIKCVNGNFGIISEHEDLKSAIVNFHDQCKIHWNADDVIDSTIAILDENLIITKYVDNPHHPAPEPELEIDQNEETSEEPNEEPA